MGQEIEGNVSSMVRGRNMLQAEFFLLYDRWARFALYKARRYLHDESQRQDAVDTAMARFVDNAQFEQVGNQLITPILDLDAWGKTVITNSIKNFARDKKLESINLEGEEYQGMHGYKVI